MFALIASMVALHVVNMNMYKHIYTVDECCSKLVPYARPMTYLKNSVVSYFMGWSEEKGMHS
jgi:hypothetical protein